VKWSDGDSIASFERFFVAGLDCDTMVQAITQMVLRFSPFTGSIIKLACLVGLRPAETVEAVKLINNKEAFAKYCNQI
jgi:hypothetical protein